MFDEYTECAFCGDPIDYCQGHGSTEYALRIIADGELSRPITYYEDLGSAYCAYDALVPTLVPGESMSIYDQAGDVEAEVSAS